MNNPSCHLELSQTQGDPNASGRKGGKKKKRERKEKRLPPITED